MRGLRRVDAVGLHTCLPIGGEWTRLEQQWAGTQHYCYNPDARQEWPKEVDRLERD